MGQFAIPLAVLGVGLIGEWLLGPKGKSTTAAPDSMPMLNSALRGQVIPITFGANRVPAQVAWTKNFTAVRQKSSGKGGAKGGGSGGFGSAKGGGSAGVSYLYYWDMMFNFGIMDTPALISKGWVGSDQLDDATISAITAGISSSFVQPDATSKSAHLAFTEAFFAPGFNTDDIRLDNWSYFQDQMGFACAFPSTAYVGFNQLELGQTPSVPQLSFELVPMNADITVTGTVYDGGNGNLSSASVGTEPFMEDNNGDVWSMVRIPDAETSDITLRRIVDTHEVTLSFSGQLGVDFAAVSPNGGYNSVARFITSMVMVPGQPYFYLTWCDIQFPSTDDTLIVILYKLNDDGSGATMVASKRMWYSAGLSNNYPNTRDAYLMDNGEVMTFSTGRSLNRHNYIVTLPSPQAMILGGIGVDSGHPAHEMNGRTYDMTDLGTDFIAGLSNGRVIVKGFVPTGGSTGHVFFYVPKGRVQYELTHTQNTFIRTAGATYPNGFMVRIDWTGVALTYPAVIDNSFFNIGGVPAFPAVDAGLNSVGAAGTDNDDWSSIAPTLDGQVIVMMRAFSDDPNRAHIRAFSKTGDMLVEKNQTFATGTLAHELTDNALYIDSGGDVWFQTRTNDTGRFDFWYVNFGTILDFAADVTPPYIIKRILTSDVFGFAASALFGFTITEASIDPQSYLAAHQYCLDQGFVFSVTYSNQDNLLSIINELVQLYGGFLTERGGKIYFNTVTATDDPIRTIDNHHLVPPSKGSPPVKTTKGALEDGYNKIQFNYLDRAIDYKQNQAEAADEVDIDINGPRVKTYQARYVMAGSVAQVIAVRALWSNLYGRDQYEFTLGWKDADIRPGMLVTLQDSFDTTLSTGVRARITHRQEDKRGVFKMQATREFPYIITQSAFFTSQASVDAGYSGLIQEAQAPLFQTAYELPREFQGAKALCYFGYNQAATAMGAQLYLSVDSGANFLLTQDQQPFLLGGRFAAPLEARPKGYVEANKEFWLLPTENFEVATPTFIQNYALDDITQAIRAAGGGVLVVGSEAVAIENLTLVGQNHYRAKYMYRGWGGSPISSHNSGEFFHAFGAGLFNHEITQNDIGTTLLYKIAPYNFAGKTFDISSIPAKSYTIKGLYWLPREQPNTKFYVDSAISWPASTPLTGPYIGVTSGGVDLHMAWPAASNDEGFGAGGFGAGTFGHFIASDSVNYRVDVASKNAVKVSSFVVTTGYFSYTLNQNSTDFNGFGHDLVFTITPFTVKGDGPVADTRSISLNW